MKNRHKYAYTLLAMYFGACFIIGFVSIQVPGPLREYWMEMLWGLK